MTVRIGIDARRYGPAGRGQERYVRCLVRAMAASVGDHELVLLCAGTGALASDLGTRARLVPAGRRLRLQHRRRLPGLRRLLVRDLDLVHFPNTDGWYVRVTRAVVTVHDLSVLRYPEAFFPDAAAERRAWRHHLAITRSADAVIAVSEATRRDVVRLLDVPEDRVETVPHGLEPRFLPVAVPIVHDGVRLRHGLPRRYVLFVGGIDFKKNVARLVEGYAIARRRGRLPHALVLAGTLQLPGHPFFDAARERAASAGVVDRLIWTGYVADADLPALYSGADALVFPSLIEGFGLPVLEAMACGTPVVTSAGSAMSEVTGDAAALVDPWEPESIAQGILRVLDPGERARLREAGLRRAAAYTWERTATQTLAVYDRVAAGEPLRAEAAR